jgi:hypothetical protein
MMERNDVRRVKRMLHHFSNPASSNDVPPSPPVVQVDTEGLPGQPFLMECSKKHGGLFKIQNPSGNERIVMTDPSMYDHLIYPDEEHLSRVGGMRQFNERGFKWKGGGIADPKVLDVIRKALGPVKAEAFADGVGASLVEEFNAWPDSGARDLFDAAHATLYPISEQLFGPSFSASACPMLRQQVEVLDRTVGGAIYQDTFVGQQQEEYDSSLKGLEDAVIGALASEANTLDSAPLLKATFGDQPVPAKWGKFGTSNVWAAQGG